MDITPSDRLGQLELSPSCALLLFICFLLLPLKLAPSVKVPNRGSYEGKHRRTCAQCHHNTTPLAYGQLLETNGEALEYMK